MTVVTGESRRDYHGALRGRAESAGIAGIDSAVVVAGAVAGAAEAEAEHGLAAGKDIP